MSDLTTVEYYGGFITEKGIIKNWKKGNNLNIYILHLYILTKSLTKLSCTKAKQMKRG